ncbi:MAG TPA: DUF6293 family protein [Thermoplasmata archaeon]|nr:DUF6293 family protein [Thermoplasmata archaeon]
MARILISTFGYDEGKVLRALRWLSYDRLVLLAGSDSLRKPGFRKLRDAERAAGGEVEVVRVDPFDFRSCFEGACGAIERNRRAENEVRVNVSGGTKVLADAALLAAYQEGVEVWHCEDKPLRLPVLRGVRFVDSFSEAERAALRSLGGPTPVGKLVEQLRAEGMREASVNRALVSLRQRGLVRMTIQRGSAVVSIEPRSEWFVRGLLGR